jgi:hypothetical protein
MLDDVGDRAAVWPSIGASDTTQQMARQAAITRCTRCTPDSNLSRL